MAEQVTLSVNDSPIELDNFVREFFKNVIEGVLAGLRGTAPIETLELSMDDDKQVTINLNNAIVPIKPFVNEVVSSTIIGMVSTLRGVNEIKRFRITIQK